MSDLVRRVSPPQHVEVLHDGVWVPASLDGWVRWDDGWRGSVAYVVAHEWGLGKYVRSVPADQVRPVE